MSPISQFGYRVRYFLKIETKTRSVKRAPLLNTQLELTNARSKNVFG